MKAQANPFEKVVASYIHNLDALREAIGPVMTVSHRVRRTALEEELKSLEKYGKRVSRKGETVTYNIPYEHLRRIDRKVKRHERAVSATEILPRAFLVSFVSEYDAFLGNLIRVLFDVRPEALNKSDRNFTYKDLHGFDTIEEARNFIVNKEVESALRLSHAEQFRWLERNFDIKLTQGWNEWPTFIELTERRNLFVHCSGIVSSQYLRVCREHGVPSNVRQGECLKADAKYLIDSYKCLYEAGVKLVQVLWRKLRSDEIALADEALNSYAYELLTGEKYDLATRLLEFAVDELPRHSSEVARRIFVVNLAQAYKFFNREQDCRSRLDEEDWSASQDRFAICVAVLRDDFSLASDIMKRMGPSGSLTEQHYAEWPVFREFRTSPEFKSTFHQVFGRKPESLQEHTKLPSSSSLEESDGSSEQIEDSKDTNNSP